MVKDLIKVIFIGRHPERTLIRSVVIAVFCIVLFKFFLIPIRIQGMSMEPTYHNGSVNFINVFYYRFRTLERGDLAAIAIGSGRRYMYFKRIVGLPGERLSFKEGKLLINGEAVYEPYMKYGCDWNMPEVLIGHDEYFAVGDNRSTSMETHEKGRIKESKILGKPLW